MIRLPLVLAFVALTFLSWGIYGPLLHHGQLRMDHALLKPFIGVGIAYFLIAVLIPGIIISQKGEKGHWSASGAVLSLVAGAVGALGALGILMALNFGGKPSYVMPFVFGLAPVVNTLVTSTINRTFNQISTLFLVGLVLVIVGAIGVLSSKDPPRKPAAADPAIIGMVDSYPLRSVAFQAEEPAEATAATATTAPPATPSADAATSAERVNWFGVLASMVFAAFCWGAYGPVLHIGQSRMGGSRLRPFCCVGLAYFFIAVALPLAMVQAGLDRGHWDTVGLIWSIGAGAVGALGALGIIYAFNFGGKPIFVMPLVFGFAPVVNTIYTMVEAGPPMEIRPLFVGSLALTIAGAVMVLVFQPRPKPGHKSAGERPRAKERVGAADLREVASARPINPVPEHGGDVSTARPLPSTSENASPMTPPVPPPSQS